jgi:hypothetical protein
MVWHEDDLMNEWINFNFIDEDNFYHGDEMGISHFHSLIHD